MTVFIHNHAVVLNEKIKINMFTSSISLLPSFYSMEVARLDSIRSTELEARNGKFSPQAAKWQLSPAWHIWWRESSHIFENVFGSTTFSSSLPLPRFDSAMVQSAISVMGNIEAQSQDCELRRPDRNLGISPWSAWQKILRDEIRQTWIPVLCRGIQNIS